MSDLKAECCSNLDNIGGGWFQCPNCGKCERRFPGSSDDGEDFQGCIDAKAWLWGRGYRCGLRQGSLPCGILKGDTMPPEWRLMTARQQDALDGRITWGGGDPRTADALVTLREAPEPIAQDLIDEAEAIRVLQGATP